ncbi:MAG: FGGY-family carbohydrate kinase [Oscillospiraceae bacterium]|nr:FGGY-family carbohydrate kinase [Oscillospiraceae bacterium]
MEVRDMITLGKTALGIEFGSTRVKAVLIGEDAAPLAGGSYSWENRLENGYWTYSLEEIHQALRASFAELRRDVREKYGCELTTAGAIGISAMMHGYLAFDSHGKLLTPFRTWRNTTTGEAAKELTAALDFNIPQRWTCAHLYQAILSGEEHVPQIAYVTTLAGYVHYMLTGVNAVGIGEASGIFPVDSEKLDYDEKMMEIYDAMTAAKGFGKKLRDVLPKVLPAGAAAGRLTESGAKLLDGEGQFKAGVPFAPCEGDAGTGMTATNSVRERTGNISAGTSVFAMVVMEKNLSRVYPEIDMVTTPAGKPVAMVHCNNCTSDINAWAGLFGEFAEALGVSASRERILDLMFERADKGEADCGGLVSYNYFSGEPVTDMPAGRPLFLRGENARFTLGNFMRVQLISAMATLKIGLDLLLKDEKAEIDRIYGHGGFYIYPEVGQRITSAAIGAPVSVMKTAGEGGPYGMALLALYTLTGGGESLEDFLEKKVFATAECSTVSADSRECEGFDRFMQSYKAGLACERAAVQSIP